MQITNYNHISEPVLRAIKHNWYSGTNAKHFCSVTQLLKPPKQFVLERRYQDQITQEASDLIWSLMGSAMHRVLEAAETSNSLNEERLSVKVNGRTISGGVDLYENEVISDFKFTSVWSYIYPQQRKEWEKQLNLYAYLYQIAGFEVRKLQIIAIFRDWSVSKQRYEKDYPPQIVTIPIRLWNMDYTDQFIRDRLYKLELALKLPDDAIEACSPRERWQKPTVYAIKKQNVKRALKLCQSRQQAEAYIKTNKYRDKLSIETRESIPKRCEDYCSVNHFCHYYRSQHPELFKKLHQKEVI